jgi:hypothetical protein
MLAENVASSVSRSLLLGLCEDHGFVRLLVERQAVSMDRGRARFRVNKGRESGIADDISWQYPTMVPFTMEAE